MEFYLMIPQTSSLTPNPSKSTPIVELEEHDKLKPNSYSKWTKSQGIIRLDTSIRHIN